LLNGLEDIQTMMRLFSTCTLHKITQSWSLGINNHTST
jgi:hypothetical protein